MTRIDWDEMVLPEVKERLTNFNDRGIIPTLRAMFYALFSVLNWFPNTETYYKSLSHHTARWRENGLLEMDCFVDQSRHVEEDFDDVYECPQEYVDRLIRYLENAPTEYRIPRWHNQPHYVEAWTEKDAQVGLLRSLLRAGTPNTIDRQVRIVPTRGYSGPSFNSLNVDRLTRWRAMDKEIHIVYFGDMDPSGENIDEVLSGKLEQYGLVNVDFQRIAITDEQITKYRLPVNPDPDTLAKLKKDSRRFQFMETHGLDSEDQLFQVEIDALAALQPDVFRDLVLNSVDQFYDEDIYEETSNETTKDDIRKIVKKSAQNLASRL
jgi:hypothetical protein